MHLRLEGERDVCRWINGGADRESNLSRAAPAAVLRLPLLRGSFPSGVGGDTTGSIRMPSHFCGTAGLRPQQHPRHHGMGGGHPVSVRRLHRLHIGAEGGVRCPHGPSNDGGYGSEFHKLRADGLDDG
jgi:hypothetical protein